VADAVDAVGEEGVFSAAVGAQEGGEVYADCAVAGVVLAC
jgi:hypothetical protein